MSPTTKMSTTAPKAKITRSRSGVRKAGNSGSRRRDVASTCTVIRSARRWVHGSCGHPDEPADERAEHHGDHEEETLEGILVERVDVGEEKDVHDGRQGEGAGDGADRAAAPTEEADPTQDDGGDRGQDERV